MKILLLIPPRCEPAQPVLGVPSLTAFLKQNGHEVVQRDLSIEAYNYFLDEDRLKSSINKVKDRLKAFERSSRPLKTVKKIDEYYNLSRADMAYPYIIANLKEAKRIAHDKEDFYDIEKYQWAFKVLDAALFIVSMEYYPITFSTSKYENIILNAWESTDKLKKCIEDERSNIFKDYYEEALRDVFNGDFKLVGISVSYMEQIVPALTLAKIIKSKNKNIHVAIGGSFISALAEKISQNRSINEYCDSFVLYDGEIPLLRLAEALEQNKSLENVPNLIYKTNGQIRTNKLDSTLKARDLPTPDFEGLPLESYFSPHIMLPILTSRGCYWRKCAFCTHYRGYLAPFSIRDTEFIIKDIKKLVSQYNARYYLFVDEATHPRTLELLSNAILRENIKIFWSCMARFDEALNPDLLAKMSKAGCRFIWFGLESGSQRILNLMEKGTRIKTIEKILRGCKQAGIDTFLMAFLGFPSETIKEAKGTLTFIEKNKRNIGWIVVEQNFILEEGSKAFVSPEKYKISRIKPNSKNEDLKVSHDYEVTAGMSQARVEKFQREAPKELSLPLRTRGHYFLYKTKWGQMDKVRKRGSNERKLLRRGQGTPGKEHAYLLTAGTIYGEFQYDLREAEQILSKYFNNDKPKIIKADKMRTGFLYNILTRESHFLYNYGIDIFVLARQKLAINEIIGLISKKFDLPINCAKDEVTRLLARLLKHGFIETEAK
ncbi:MAG: radical SAM protein [Methylococcales bacterium]|nr:radical SAM protein [Methylococcales bacterium]